MTSAAARDVSVVIPTYNRAALLAQTLASLDCQTVTAAEIIVVDDGSTDSTQDLLAAHGVTVITNPHGGWGPGRARNFGLERVSTKFVAFVDSDDLLFPRALERLRAALLAQPEAPFAYGCGLAVMQVHGAWHHMGVIARTRAEERDPLASIFVRNSVPASGTLANADLVRRLGGYDRAVEWSEDHHLWIRLAQQGPPAYVPDLVCAYRRHPGNRFAGVEVGGDAAAILSLANDDPRLRPYVPDRIGVLLCESLVDAVQSRRPRAFAVAVRQLLPHATRPDRILARALSQLRIRKAGARLGDRVWEERSDIRAWLADF